MKTRTQTASAFAAALFCAAAWFAVWLTAFEPLPVERAQPADLPAFALRASSPETDLSRPTLFALPAEQGFSGTFPEQHVHMDFQRNDLQQPDAYLPRGGEARPVRPEMDYSEPVSLPQIGELNVPEPAYKPIASQPGTYLFFSPELEPRSLEDNRLTLSGKTPLSVRVQLQVEADGTVSQCFSETPIEHSLTASLRGLHFAPAATPVNGWIEIRFIPEGGTE